MRLLKRVLLAGACFAATLASGAAESYSSGIFTIHLGTPNEELAQTSLRVLHAGVQEYSERLPAGDEPIHVYVAQEYREFRQLGAPEGRIEGFARSEQGIIVMKAPNLLGPHGTYPSILRHELLHVLLARNSGVDHLPRWLNEGIAMLLSRENRWSNAYHIARMYTTSSIIEYDTLPYVFAQPGNEVEFGDAYAQSLSMTKYLRDLVGEETFWAMIEGLKDETFEKALERHTGLSHGEFFQQWQRSLWRIAVITSLISGFGIFQFGAILLILAYWRKRRRGRRVLADWKVEEAEEEEMLFAWQLENQDPPQPWESEEDDEYRA